MNILIFNLTLQKLNDTLNKINMNNLTNLNVNIIKDYTITINHNYENIENKYNNPFLKIVYNKIENFSVDLLSQYFIDLNINIILCNKYIYEVGIPNTCKLVELTRDRNSFLNFIYEYLNISIEKKETLLKETFTEKNNNNDCNTNCFHIEIDEKRIFEEIKLPKNFNSNNVYELNHIYNEYKGFKNNSFLHINKFIDASNRKDKLIEISNEDFNFLKLFIVIIDFNNLGGGTGFFINTIISKYKYFQTFLILRSYNEMIEFNINDEYVFSKLYNYNEAFLFLKNNNHKINKIFFNHILGHSHSFLLNLFNLNKEVSLITHDYCTIMQNPQPYYIEIQNEMNIKKNDDKININLFDQIITQNINNLPIFEKFLKSEKKIIISMLPDFKNSLDLIQTNNKTIVIGVLGYIHNIKGRQIIISLNNYIKKNKLNIKIVVFGYISDQNIQQKCYKDINELNNLFIHYKPNILLESNIWPETWSYTLTIAMLTQLPILSLKKPYINTIENRLTEYNKTYYYHNINDIISFVEQNKQDFFYTVEPIIYFNDFWDDYFITKREKNNTHLLNNQNIKPYFIYFPQFHSFQENDTSFYPGFTDITNLDLLINTNIYHDTEKPSFKEFFLNDIQDYKLSNKMIIQKQIDILTDYGLPGFAIYFYWFSLNTITNENMIMETIINTFFDNNIEMKDKKIFFIWANEDWSKNVAFGNNSAKIENEYTPDNIQKITDVLFYYFKKEAYLKINNKPVFSLHHPWFIQREKIDLFYTLLNNKCIENGMNGIHLIVNSMNETYDKYINYNHNFNYKKGNSSYYDSNKKQIVLDYKNYINQDIIVNEDKNLLHSIVFDFDNRARLFKPNRLTSSTICIHNTEFDKIRFIRKIIHNYEKNNNEEKENIQNILFIIAWNEWGEKMSFEPSEEYGYYNLNLLCEYLSCGTPNTNEN